MPGKSEIAHHLSRAVSRSELDLPLEQNLRGSGMQRREKLLFNLDVSKLVGIEIGALDKPFIQRNDGNILYVDYTDREGLVEKYRQDPNVNVENIVRVDAIWGENTLADAVDHRKVDYVIASHVIEHVPDLITWLAELRSILKDTGEVRLMIPDRRFTFDYLREETRFADVVNSFLLRARVPQPHSVLDFLLNAVRLDCTAAWDGEIETSKLVKFQTFENAVKIARDVLDNGTYHDVHCWVFTPKSFGRLMAQMADVGLLDFACDRFHDTEKHTFEFFVSLRPSSDRRVIARSWRRMAEMAKDMPDSATHACRDATPEKRDPANCTYTMDEIRAMKTIVEPLDLDHGISAEWAYSRDPLGWAHATRSSHMTRNDVSGDT